MEVMFLLLGLGVGIVCALSALFNYAKLCLLVFQESVLLGVLCLAIQVPFLFFVTLRWDKAGDTFLKLVASILIGFVAMEISIASFHT